MTARQILLVDDEALVRRVLRRGLEKAGYDVTLAENGVAALEKLDGLEPDVLITDIEMPKMDGRALCEAVEARFPQRRFPIFVATSLTEREHRVWSSRLNNLQFLEKPLSMRALLAALAGHFGDPGVAAAD